jgi:hypothetical protein
MVKLEGPREKLLPESLLNYAKVYSKCVLRAQIAFFSLFYGFMSGEDLPVEQYRGQM